jgi:RNA recognition motif-containing protein
MYMAQFGEIDSCVVMRDPSGRSRGFAFLTYKHPSSVTKVLEKTHHLDGKQVSLIDALADAQTLTHARSIRSAPSRARSTNAPPRSLLAAWPPA